MILVDKHRVLGFWGSQYLRNGCWDIYSFTGTILKGSLTLSCLAAQPSQDGARSMLVREPKLSILKSQQGRKLGFGAMLCFWGLLALELFRLQDVRLVAVGAQGSSLLESEV